MFETRTDRLCGKVSAGNLRWPEKDSGSTRDAERRRNNGSRAPAGEMRPAEEERWEGDEKPGPRGAGETGKAAAEQSGAGTDPFCRD